MNVLELITKKRDGLVLTSAEIGYLIKNYTAGKIPDYQMAAFLMAVYLQQIDQSETAALTHSMAHSGRVLSLKKIRRIVIDKHSTGGVGDGISLVLAPLVAAAGVPVLMMSGRGLGHTGGTLDKLESILGFRTNLSAAEAMKQLQQIGIVMIGQTREMAPADRKIYALRDATATVENAGLICASILSKKIAAGIDGLVLDVKCGSGAFMTDLESAICLARLLVKVGCENGLKMKALITDMNQPLGRVVGNSLEIEQAITVLQNKGPQDFIELTLVLGAQMLMMAQKAKTVTQARSILKELLESSQALNKFYQLIESQGGQMANLPKAKHRVKIKSSQSGYLNKINTKEVGLCAVLLGAGRLKKEDKIDPGAGIILNKKLGEKIDRGDVLAELCFNQVENLNALRNRFIRAYEIKAAKPKSTPLIYKIIS